MKLFNIWINSVSFLFAFVDTNSTECKDIWKPKRCDRYKKSGLCGLGFYQFWCAKTCFRPGLTKCEDPNTNKECKNLLPGKILKTSQWQLFLVILTFKS